MPVSAQAAFAVCAGLLFLIGVLDAVGVIPVVLRMLSLDVVDQEAEERPTRRERLTVGGGGGGGSSRPLLRASRSGVHHDDGRGGAVGVSGGGGHLAGGLSRGASRAAAELQRSGSKGSRWKPGLSVDGRTGGSVYKSRSKLREVVEHDDGGRPLAYAGSGASRGSYSSGVSRGSSPYSQSEGGSSSDEWHLYSTDGEACGDGSSVTTFEKDGLLGNDWSTDGESDGGGRGRGGGGGALRRSPSTACARRAYAHPGEDGGGGGGGGRWASGSDVEAGGGRAAKGPRRATFSTPAAEQILQPRAVLPALARAEKAMMVLTWERVLGAFLCVCSLLSLLGSYVAMNGLPELLAPGRRLTAPTVGAPTVLQEERA
ncbi:hypothetical protein BU14_0111s0047 [Porphyra umbilicalis]|uniref:Uncharacterized protein n=1 Tax=Porphyra umbilicalis TaxID=2786 RepID=A0A1X6PBX0_PORUM|nr:hypothetical protein BU14_0111s0047 [Porphyra umbilicalis]|eukprot:OSX78378.1 hypothetical protein BU14_0111s0047 [Porphyra umbilicalis]